MPRAIHSALIHAGNDAIRICSTYCKYIGVGLTRRVTYDPTLITPVWARHTSVVWALSTHHESCKDWEHAASYCNDRWVVCEDAGEEAAAEVQPHHEEEAEAQRNLQNAQQHRPRHPPLPLLSQANSLTPYVYIRWHFNARKKDGCTHCTLELANHVR